MNDETNQSDLDLIVQDVLESMALALRIAGVNQDVINDAVLTALDYFGNEYG